MSIANHRWLGFMLLASLRYCMGRQSYAVGVCCDFLRDNWFEIDPKTRNTMRRDLAEEIERAEKGLGFLGADFDHAEWRKLLAFMDEPTSGTGAGDA